MKNKVKTYGDLKDQKKENLVNNNKKLHLKQDQILYKVQTVIKEQHPVLDKILTVIQQQYLARLTVIKISHKLLIPPVKFLQGEVKIYIISKDQKKEDQAKILPLPKKVQAKVQDKMQDQDKQQDQFRLQTVTKEVDNLQDSQQVDKIVLRLLKPH